VQNPTLEKMIINIVVRLFRTVDYLGMFHQKYRKNAAA
jgi:hypothetical protein